MSGSTAYAAVDLGAESGRVIVGRCTTHASTWTPLPIPERSGRASGRVALGPARPVRTGALRDRRAPRPAGAARDRRRCLGSRLRPARARPANARGPLPLPRRSHRRRSPARKSGSRGPTCTRHRDPDDSDQHRLSADRRRMRIGAGAARRNRADPRPDLLLADRRARQRGHRGIDDRAARRPQWLLGARSFTAPPSRCVRSPIDPVEPADAWIGPARPRGPPVPRPASTCTWCRATTPPRRSSPPRCVGGCRDLVLGYLVAARNRARAAPSAPRRRPTTSATSAASTARPACWRTSWGCGSSRSACASGSARAAPSTGSSRVSPPQAGLTCRCSIPITRAVRSRGHAGAIAASAARAASRRPATPGELVLAILVSLACKYRLVLERLERATARRSGRARDRRRRSQRAALPADRRLLGRPVIAGPVEATALGNVLVQARADRRARVLGGASRAVAAESRGAVTYEPDGPDRRTYARFLEVTGCAVDRARAA